MEITAENITDTPNSISRLFEDTRDHIEEMEETHIEEMEETKARHLLAAVRIDPEPLHRGNDILRVCALEMAGKTGCSDEIDDLHMLDYRTCLYSDRTVTVLVTAWDEEQAEKCEATVKKTLKSLVRQSLRLEALSANIRIIRDNGEGYEKLNSDLADLNIELGNSGMTGSPQEQEINSLIRGGMHIDTRRASVAAAAELLIRNEEQKRAEEEKRRDGKIQAGIGLMAIFAIASAFTDVRDVLIRFLPGSDGSWQSLFASELLIPAIVMLMFTAAISVLAVIFVIKAWRNAWKDRKKPRRTRGDR